MPRIEGNEQLSVIFVWWWWRGDVIVERSEKNTQLSLIYGHKKGTFGNHLMFMMKEFKMFCIVLRCFEKALKYHVEEME